MARIDGAGASCSSCDSLTELLDSLPLTLSDPFYDSLHDSSLLSTWPCIFSFFSILTHGYEGA